MSEASDNNVERQVLEARVQGVSFDGAAIVLVRLGNDHYPVFEQAEIQHAREILEPLIRRCTNAPILFWNHAIDITVIQTPGMGVTPNNEPGPVIEVPLTPRAQRSVNV